MHSDTIIHSCPNASCYHPIYTGKCLDECWRRYRGETKKMEPDIAKMKVFVLADDIDGYVYGVFADEEKAYEWGNTHLRSTRWSVDEKEVK